MRAALLLWLQANNGGRNGRARESRHTRERPLRGPCHCVKGHAGLCSSRHLLYYLLPFVAIITLISSPSVDHSAVH